MNKKFLFITLVSLFSVSSQAVEILSAKLDASKTNLIVTVAHGGGCGDHSYELKMGVCLESMPVQCQATIKHMTNDFCEAIISREAKFSLKKYKLTDKYYAGGKLTITGDSKSSATVILPSGSSSSSSSSSTKGIRCTTHTGSELVITTKKVTLVTTNNDVAEYAVTDTRFVSIETMPSIDQTTLKLDDGRSIVLEFRSGSNTGTGEFIRLDGTRSPEFTCQR
jgi:hypothetical protein